MSIPASGVCVQTHMFLVTSIISWSFRFFWPETCSPYAVYAFRPCHCKVMPFSAELCPNQAGGVAALFHLPHRLFHHFVNSALNSSWITNPLRYVVQYCALNRMAEQISHTSCWRVAINCARYSHDFIVVSTLFIWCSGKDMEKRQILVNLYHVMYINGLAATRVPRGSHH